MKHAKILYTCVGLMGAAAITGFMDYSDASKAGLLKGLYQEETTANVMLLHDKEIEFDNYSRAAFEYEGSEKSIVLADEPKKKKRGKDHEVPPPPPPIAPEAPPVPEVKSETPAPIAPEVPVTTEIPAVAPEPPTPAKDEILETPVTPPVPLQVVEIKEVSMKSFSRGPLKTKKIKSKAKNNQ
jgi:hypothetical protein